LGKLKFKYFIRKNKMIVIIIDWDNTLFASSYLTSLGQNPGVIFPKLAESIKALLECAKKQGKLFIITNAELEWIPFCIEHYLPGCEDLCQNLEVVSARTRGMAEEKDFALWKTMAFETVCEGLPKEETHELISFGDCVFDRSAAIHIKNTYNNVTVKNIKLVQNPSLEQLYRQQQLVMTCFDYIFSHDGHLDLMLTISLYGNSCTSSSDDKTSKSSPPKDPTQESSSETGVGSGAHSSELMFELDL